MNYFMTRDLQAPLSAIEQTMLERVALFAAHQEPAQVITCQYDRQFAWKLAQQQIDPQQVCNLYDVLQEAEGYTGAALQPQELPLAQQLVPIADAGHYDFKQGNQLLARAFLFQNHGAAVNYVDYLNQKGQTVTRDFYDCRGFKSLTQVLDAQGHAQVETYWSVSGRPVYQTFYEWDAAQQQNRNTLIQLLDHNGVISVVRSLEELYGVLLDRLNTAHPGPNLFVADRHEVACWPLVKMKTPAVKILQMHSTHTKDPQQPHEKELAYYVNLSLQPSSHFSGIVTPTKRQQADLQRLTTLPVFCVPVGWFEQMPPRVPVAHRDAHEMIAIARLSPEKNLGDLIQAMPAVLAVLPQTHLTIYGAPMAGYAESKRLKKMVSALHLDAQIRFGGFQDDLRPIYQRARLLAVTSQYEGFNRAILEALSNGVPVVSYNVDYGPTEMVHPGQNGLLVPYGDLQQLSQALLQLLQQNQTTWQQWSDQAQASVAVYSAAHIWQGWQQVLALKGAFRNDRS
ncbi:poly(glycerol-phosphate) alpha-glucosyltransferase [Lactobacillus selangorensis]|uniref:Poly(Glycerol-phosphate) alpha-glucosyltransferase n=1 Tax=Lactobacillus selangorensis TaxID=81857 RepID=A0A0R2FPQ9_9LACO|nr:glycosyltransferase [Lactobacillus selangorensis]KRN27986.1 poly(glycerol-phosphate) alpha-glucosyltransferase [Lactobacillus selangorensis]KRN30543.1 poly(glycerol-phosphate) alpha-glucosyltransferase [Lactobacillus selangorensis]